MSICRRGHESERNSWGQCRQCRREYLRQYREDNPDKRNREAELERMRRFHERRKAACIALQELGIKF